MEYARREDVPWSSDEEALVNDILKRNPKFFEESIPFIGYVQFLYEAQLPGGHRIKVLHVDIGWCVSGIHQPARDKGASEKREVPWRFRVR